MLEQKNSYLFDADALIYWVYKESPYNAEVAYLINTILRNNGSLYALSSSLNNIYRFLNDFANEEVARNSLAIIAQVFSLVDLTTPLIAAAIDSSETDYENGLIRAAAETLQVDAIVSYNDMAFRSSFIPRVTALEALKLLSQ